MGPYIPGTESLTDKTRPALAPQIRIRNGRRQAGTPRGQHRDTLFYWLHEIPQEISVSSIPAKESSHTMDTLSCLSSGRRGGQPPIRSPPRARTLVLCPLHLGSQEPTTHVPPAMAMGLHTPAPQHGEPSSPGGTGPGRVEKLCLDFPFYSHIHSASRQRAEAAASSSPQEPLEDIYSPHLLSGRL